MSHWAKYSADVMSSMEMPILKQALEEMGITLDETVKHLSDSYGDADVDAAFIKDGHQMNLGMNFEEVGRVRGKMHHKVTVNGDFWNTGLDEQMFCRTLSQIYMKINAQAKLKLQGWTVTKVETDTEGKVHIRAARRAA